MYIKDSLSTGMLWARLLLFWNQPSMAIYMWENGERHITVKCFGRNVARRLASNETQLQACGPFMFLASEGFDRRRGGDVQRRDRMSKWAELQETIKWDEKNQISLIAPQIRL